MLVVFDFDGTLADSLTVLLDIYNNDIATRWKLKNVTTKNWHELRQLSIPQGIKAVGAKPYQLASMLNEGRKLVKARSADIKLFPGAAKLVKQLVKDGHQIYALSTNDQVLVADVLAQAGLGGDVCVLKSPLLFGKANSLRRLVKQTGTPAGQAWMIGDEVRDMNAARRSGVNSIAVTWGFQPEVTLAKHQPTAIARSLSDIPKILAGK